MVIQQSRVRESLQRIDPEGTVILIMTSRNCYIFKILQKEPFFS